MVGKQDKTYYIMAPSQITDDMKTQAATAYVQFMKTDAYKTLSRRIRDMKTKFRKKQECNISRAKK